MPAGTGDVAGTSEHTQGGAVDLIATNAGREGTAVDVPTTLDVSGRGDGTYAVDDVIEHIGGFGRYQKRLYLILGFTFFVNGALNLQQVIIERAPTSLCASQAALTHEICADCSDGSDPLGGHFVGQFVDDSTVAASFELVCNRAVLRGYIGSIFFLGFGIGSYGMMQRWHNIHNSHPVELLAKGVCSGGMNVYMH